MADHTDAAQLRHRQVRQLLDAIVRDHHDHHEDALRWCPHPDCVLAHALRTV